MSGLSIPNWVRMLGWGLLASLVLHWVMFDLMRAAAWLPRAPGAAALQVKLAEHASRMKPAVSQSTPAAASPQPDKPVHAMTGSNVMSSGPSRDAVSPAQQPEVILAGSVQVTGLRSGQPAEAMVALRLAIASLLAADRTYASAESTPQAVLLWCDFDEAGRLAGIRAEAGTTLPALRNWLKRAAAQIVMPETLVGRAFSLDLLVESSDQPGIQ
jgi:hypothetical protein